MITPLQYFNIRRGFFTLLLATTSISFLWANGENPCQAMAAEGAGHAIWLSNYQNGKHANYFFDQQGGHLVENEDGTAHVYGTIYNKKNPNDQWEVALYLSDRMTWDEWSALGRKYKDQNNKAGDLYKTWSYYIMDPDQESILTGKGDNAGKLVPIVNNPVDYTYGFQIGQAANDKNENFGLSGWFLYFLDGDKPKQGDFNFDLSCPKTNDPPTTDCLAAAAAGGGHAMWVSQYSNGKNAQFQFLEGGSVKQFDDGTGHISGTVYLPDHPEDKWDIDVWMTAAKNWTEWSATGGGYKGNPSIVGNMYKTWTYYILDVTKDNRLIGKGKNEGEVVFVQHYPAGYEYAVQVGKAANDKNGNYGLSVWFTYEHNGKLMRGDFNLDLSCEAEEPEPDCDVNELAANMDVQDVSCANAQDGSIKIEIIGGVAPFTFAWSNGATTQDISALGGGNYSVTITDANEGTLQLSGTVFEPTPLSVMGQVSPLSCGATNGSITLDVSGGTAPFTYSWSNGSNDKDLMGLTAGSYQATVTDANGCSITEDFTLLATSDITASIVTNSCNDGFLSADIIGGVPPYTYNWSNGETTKDIRVTEAGTYQVTITDVSGCSTTASETIGSPTILDLAVQPIVPSCAGNSDGAIDLTVSGGLAPYSYSWSFNNSEIATSEDLNGVASGKYTVTVTDANGCANVLEYFLANPTSIFISESVELIRCDGNGMDGEIDIRIFNAAAPYSVEWTRSSTAGIFSTEEDLTGLGPDVYTLTVTDANGCQATKTVELVAPEDFQVDLTQQYCGDGRICPTLSGGNGPFNYQWTGPNGTITTIDGCIDATEAGDYTVQVIDANGCVKTATINIGAPNPSLQATVTSTEPSCPGASDGTAAVSVSGGDGNYSILWSTGANTPSITGLSAGTYTVKVNDGNDCQQFRAFNIQDPQGLEITAAQITEVSCNGEMDGSIDITVVNGTAPYTYQWSNGAATEDLAAVGTGSYDVTVTDASGCSVVMSYDILVDPNNTNCDNGNGDGGNDGGDGGDGGNGDGNGDGNDDPCIRDCNTCDGKITELTLKYLGDEANATITVKQKNGGQIVFDEVVAPEEEFSFSGTDTKGTLTSEIIITINGSEETTIHTSCSQPIGPGLIAGEFEVVAGESRNGGPLCPVEPDTEQEEEDEQEVAPQGEDCATCHETQLISISETDAGCITYTLEVTNNGACAHALSHFSVRIPCGIVTEASNSEGWKMELNAKDPATNLYGLKVDDIHGFGENGNEGSFTVTYTVCPNQDETCVKELKSDNIIVGYKAAQCAKIETVGLNDQVANFEQPKDDTPLTFIRFSVYPNPVESNSSTGLKLELEEANIGELLNVKVLESTGRSIYAERVEVTGDKQVLPLKMAGLTPGIYYVTITSHHKVYSEKIIVK